MESWRLVLGKDSYKLDDGNMEIHVTYTLSAMEKYFKRKLYIDLTSQINDPFADNDESDDIWRNV